MLNVKIKGVNYAPFVFKLILKIFIINETGHMKINTNHPTFITFIENVNNSILSNISPEKYFSLTQSKKVSLQYLTLKLVIQSVKIRAKLTDDELYEFTGMLQKRNEDNENYEFAGVLKDVLTNFESLNEMTKTGRRQKRTVTTDKTTNE